MQKITAISRYTTNKQGDALVTKSGRPYTSVRIKTEEHGDKFISGFGNPQNANWKVGDEIDVVITQKGEYLNFEMKKDSGPAANNAGTAEIKNILMLKVIPMLNAIHDELKTTVATEIRDFQEPTF